ncbi:hypothetical protein [Fimbriiglobus ruber]|uniref:Immunity protein 35 domain-containing protein n=1 Tax=Fimbriiglobus ruber TaxID=1908690 RepID=A0A225E8G8_9BACT|nr:hypothetical protein [Fimbriiglobus ruber]OWK45789.1 hypothetical protein FRUB_02120 [Fimbriiglobus ruber]
MTLDEAEREVLAYWGHACEDDFGGPARVDPDRTEVYDWGWVIYLVPVNPENCPPQGRKSYPYAIHNVTGRSIVVGSKALEYAVYELTKVYTKPIDWPPGSPRWAEDSDTHG